MTTARIAGQDIDQYKGRRVAQAGGAVLFSSDSPEAVLVWLRRHNLKARVWRIPAGPEEAGSALSAS